MDAPDTPFTANETFSVAPAATLRVSVSEDMAIVPNELVRLMAAPDEDARTVRSTEEDAFGMLNVYEVTDGSNAGDSDPTLTDIESSVDVAFTARAASPSAAATPPMSVPGDPTRILLSEPL